MSHPLVYEPISIFPKPPQAAFAQAWIDRSQTGFANPISPKELILAIFTNANELIGNVSLHLNGQASEGELGYWLDPAFYGQGYATEAAEALLLFGFKKLNLSRITATCCKTNVASQKVLVKLGMQLNKEAMLKTAKGTQRLSLYYEMTAASFHIKLIE